MKIKLIFSLLVITLFNCCSNQLKLNPDTNILKSTDFIYSFRSATDAINNTRQLGYTGAPLKGITTRQLSNAPFLYKKCAPGTVLLVSIDAESIGSGSIINSDGEIITNWHVVEGQDKMLVWFYDENTPSLKDLDPDKVAIANVIAIDKSRDLALLTFTKKKDNLKPLEFGNDYQIQVAQDVFAIGHPESYLWSFNYGVISRLPTDEEWYYDNKTNFKADVIQTQTPTNPGNSGGPLFNDKGQLIGINSYSSSGEGLNFAIRLREVKNFITEVKQGKYQYIATEAKTKDKREIEWVPLDSNGNGIIDSYTCDSQGDGFYDVAQVDKNEDGIINYYILDVNHDGEIDVYIYDRDGNGAFEYFEIDDDYNGTFETVAIDTDGDSIPDSFSKNSG